MSDVTLLILVSAEVDITPVPSISAPSTTSQCWRKSFSSNTHFFCEQHVSCRVLAHVELSKIDFIIAPVIFKMVYEIMFLTFSWFSLFLK